MQQCNFKAFSRVPKNLNENKKKNFLLQKGKTFFPQNIKGFLNSYNNNAYSSLEIAYDRCKIGI